MAAKIDSSPIEYGVIHLEAAGKEISILGVEKISFDGKGIVSRIIEQEKPDAVCVDLDKARAQILSDESQWESLSIREVIRENLLTALLLNLLLAGYKRILDSGSVSMPGGEIYEAVNESQVRSIPVELIERDLHITYARASKSVNYREKFSLLLGALKRLFRFHKLSDEEKSEFSSDDVMTAFFRDVTDIQPKLKVPLLDERDQFTANKIANISGKNVLVVIGSGRIAGIRSQLLDIRGVVTNDLEEVPTTSPASKWVKRIIPILLVVGLLYITWSQGKEFVRENLAFWIAANSIFTGLGAVLAGAHILAIITAIVVAPFSPLIPAGPGTVAAIVQLLIRPPLVRDFQTFPDDISHILSWRRNRILKILLVLIFCGLGSIIGTILGTSRIFFSFLSLD